MFMCMMGDKGISRLLISGFDNDLGEGGEDGLKSGTHKMK